MPEPSRDADVGGRKLPGVSPSSSSVRRAAALALAAALVAVLTGCAKMDAALGKQWVVVSFKPHTTLTTLEKVRTACSHVPNVHPYALPRQHTVINLMSGVRYDTTHATDANVAELQVCLQKFSSVQGFTPRDAGDAGG
jgi:hypothetical protein